MRRRRFVTLTLTIALVLGTTWVLRAVLSPPRRVAILTHGTGAAQVFHSAVLDADITPDGRYLLTTGHDVGPGKGFISSLRAWDVRSWRLAREIPDVLSLGGHTATGERLLTCDSDGRARLRQSDTLAADSKADWPADRHLRSVVLSPDGRWIATIPDRASSVGIWGTVQSRRTRLLPYGSRLIGFSPNSRLLTYAVQGWGPCAIHFADAQTGRIVHKLRADTVTWMPDGAMLVGGTSDGILTFRRASDWKLTRRVATGARAISSLRISPDGKLLAIGSSSMLQLFDVETGREYFRSPLYSVHALQFSTDGSLLAAMTGGEVHVWQIPPKLQLDIRAALLGPF